MRRNTFEDAQEIRICQGDIDYRGVVEHINEGVVIIREGKIVFANNSFCEISRRSPEQVFKADFSSFLSAVDRERVARYCTERLFTDRLSDRIEFSMPREDGDAIIEMKVSVIECGGAPAILGALTDITERRKTRIELERIKDRFESILQSMSEVVVSISPNGYWILAINPAAEALYGVPARDFTSGESHIMSFVHPDDLVKVKQFYDNLPEAEFDETQYRIISSDKRVKWVRDEGHVVYTSRGAIRRIDHVIKDITEERKAIEALRQNEAKYRDFFESTSDMAFTLSADGRFLDINNAGMKLLGFENKEIALASNVKDFYVDLAEREDLIQELYGKGRIEGKHVRFRDKTGEAIEVAITARVKTDDGGGFLYHEGIAQNISRALEEQRNRVLRNAAGSMCHYLNTHLMHLLGSKDGVMEEMAFLDELVEELALGRSPHEAISQIQMTLKNMRFFADGVASAYERIAEVTKALNQAFRYEEESYVINTILNIFKSCGYNDCDDPN